MTEIYIKQPHGYLKDSEGRVIQRFANWRVGQLPVHPDTDSIEYVDGPAAHDAEIHEDYRDQS